MHKLLGAAVIAGLVSNELGASVQARRQLNWQVTPSVGTAAAEGWRMFDSSGEIPVTVTAMNDEESGSPVLLAPGFFEALDMSLVSRGSGEVVARAATWADTGVCAGQPDCPLGSPKSLKPGEAALFTARLQLRARSTLPPGDYTLQASLGDARQFLRDPNLQPWRGRAPEVFTVAVTIRPPNSALERRQADREDVERARGRRDYAEVLRLMDRQVADAPNDADPHAGRGHALMELGRYSEAASAYERALALTPNAEESYVPGRLALAYMASGQEANAERIVRRFTLHRDVPVTLNQLRDRAKRLKRP